MSYHLQAPAKVNIHLEIGPARADGYHVLRSLCVKVNLYDHIWVDIVPQGYQLTGNNLPTFNTKCDLLYKAMLLYQKLSGLSFGLRLKINKSIPICAGLGGGSSDAGTLLAFLNAHFQAVPLDRLAQESATLGADIPLFVYPYTTAWVEGIGEEVTAIPYRKQTILLYIPPYGINTKQAYQALDPYVESLGKLGKEEAVRAFAGSVPSWPFFNSFSQKLHKEYPNIAYYQQILSQQHWAYVSMSGSGSTMFIVDTSENLLARQDHISPQFLSCVSVETLPLCPDFVEE